MADLIKGGGGDVVAQLYDIKMDGSESPIDFRQVLALSHLKRHLRKTYGRRPMELVSRYFRAVFDYSTYTTKLAFLRRCRSMRVVPEEYRVVCHEIKNTRRIIQILDKCSYKLMLADLDYNQMRKTQVARLLELLHKKIEKALSHDDLQSMLNLSKIKYVQAFESARAKQRAKFDQLLKEYKLDGKEEEEAESEA
ncbi:hypothetical protein HPB51_024736 [Rhipicephalus microplus]|uniref:Uncharacterized protein n=1 Tax=Rhipicephalus microplus TaxID=6941 RepID=A0A9J6EJ50_RHIMP|nr:uncharacterized protein LOC119162122 [Rhipicephalus microplus]KAH8034481.1 hypothetical protein HPB51_024736 [Rhipicephalus microplus]